MNKIKLEIVMNKMWNNQKYGYIIASTDTRIISHKFISDKVELSKSLEKEFLDLFDLSKEEINKKLMINEYEVSTLGVQKTLEVLKEIASGKDLYKKEILKYMAIENRLLTQSELFLVKMSDGHEYTEEGYQKFFEENFEIREDSKLF